MKANAIKNTGSEIRKNNSNKDNTKKGFQKFNSLMNGASGKSINSLKDHYKEFIKNSGPYYFFITLTFGKYLGLKQRCRFTNDLLNRYNQVIFRRTYKKRNKCMAGFAVLEDHYNCEFEDRYHIHMLVKPNVRYDDFSLAQHIDIFHTVAGEILYGKRRVFNDKYIDIQKIEEDQKAQDKVSNYCMKEISDKNIDRIKLIGIDGLSDCHLPPN